MEGFTRTLTKTDIERRLRVPTASLEAFAIAEDAYHVDFDAVDITGHTWSFRHSTRRKGTHPKPVLSRGWPEFVAKKNLKENDRIILHVNEDQANNVRFRIQAQRMVRLFGEDYWRNVEDFDPE